PDELMVKPRLKDAKPVVEEPVKEESASAKVVADKEEIAPLPEENAVPDVSDEALSGFASWLKMVNSGAPAEVEETAPVEEKVAAEEKKTEKIRESDQNIIERFIREEPRIKPQKTSFYSPVNMAKKSVQESDEFITETLARIYAKQGNTSKAIRAYQKLSL